jgi:hypothetical protein
MILEQFYNDSRTEEKNCIKSLLSKQETNNNKKRIWN